LLTIDDRPQEVYKLARTYKPGPHIEYKATLADGDDLRRAGLPATPANPGQRACSVVVDNVWVVHPLDEAWVAAYRLVIQKGAFVVGEVRIYPMESVKSGLRLYSPGDWSGIWRGLDATVPDGGLTTTLVRKGGKMNPSLRASRGILHDLKKRYPDAGMFSDLQKHGLVNFAKPKPSNPTSGRLGKPMKYYKRVAKEYTRALERNSRHPIQDVALALDFDSDSKARDAVHRARKLDLLPKTTRGAAKTW